jgi:hypothetical protein
VQKLIARLRALFGPRPSDARVAAVLEMASASAVVPIPAAVIGRASKGEAAALVSAAPRRAPAPVRKPRPKGPSNKQMLERTLKALERVEQRLRSLEHEVVRKDANPPRTDSVGYI